jgi:hypothetical protein
MKQQKKIAEERQERNNCLLKKGIVILAHAFVGWAGCALTMGVGLSVTSLINALIIHAFAAPIVFFFVSLIYFRRFHYCSPALTAILFLGFVIFMDFFLVGLVIQKSLEMFTSVLGTWIPFLLIYLSTYLTGSFVRPKG